MGEVFLARHQRLARPTAVKVLARELSGSSEMLERFFAEARTTSSIQHHGIVEVLDCDVDSSGVAYIVMEYLEGATLGRVLTRAGRLPLGDLIEAGRQIADAVGAAHRQGIVHRDLKPENVFVLVEPRRRLKVLDFGIAKLLSATGDAEGGLTRTGRLLGTPVYMSPEQCRGTGGVDHRADIYALGCMLFQMACGRPPFAGEFPGELIAAHLLQPAPSVRDLAAEVPEPLARLIAAMLEKEPDARPPSMESVAQALDVAGQERAGAVPVSSVLVVDASEVHRGELIEDGALSAALGDAGGASGARLLPAVPRAGGTRPLASVGQTTFSRAASEVQVAAPLGGSRKRRGLLLALVGSVVVAGAGGLWVLRTRATTAPPASTFTASDERDGRPAALDVAGRETVRIGVASGPPGLVARLDGAPRALPLWLPRSAQEHVLTFSAPGYADLEMRVDGSRDQSLVLQMKPAEASPGPRPFEVPGSASRARRSESPRSTTPGPAPSGAAAGAEEKARARREGTDVFTDL